MAKRRRTSKLCGASVQLGGIGHYFPGEPVTNQFFEDIPALGIDHDWIVRNTGVHRRHWANPDEERHVEMGRQAAQRAMDKAGVAPEDIDIIIGTTSTARPRVNPSSLGNNYMDIAPPLQRQLKAKNAFLFDVTAIACAGFLHASLIAQSLLSSLSKQTALVVCAENPKPILNFGYRNSALFGGGAAAAVWQRTEGPSDLVDVVLHADGGYFDAFDIDPEDKMMMKGGAVGETAPGLLSQAIEEIMARNELSLDDIDWVVPHQANTNLIADVVNRVGAPESKILLNLPDRGNTSSVGAPSCLSEHLEKGTIRSGDLILTMSIGRGFSWGAMLLHCGRERR